MTTSRNIYPNRSGVLWPPNSHFDRSLSDRHPIPSANMRTEEVERRIEVSENDNPDANLDVLSDCEKHRNACESNTTTETDAQNSSLSVSEEVPMNQRGIQRNFRETQNRDSYFDRLRQRPRQVRSMLNPPGFVPPPDVPQPPHLPCHLKPPTANMSPQQMLHMAKAIVQQDVMKLEEESLVMLVIGTQCLQKNMDTLYNKRQFMLKKTQELLDYEKDLMRDIVENNEHTRRYMSECYPGVMKILGFEDHAMLSGSQDSSVDNTHNTHTSSTVSVISASDTNCGVRDQNETDQLQNVQMPLRVPPPNLSLPPPPLFLQPPPPVPFLGGSSVPPSRLSTPPQSNMMPPFPGPGGIPFHMCPPPPPRHLFSSPPPYVAGPLRNGPNPGTLRPDDDTRMSVKMENPQTEKLIDKESVRSETVVHEEAVALESVDVINQDVPMKDIDYRDLNRLSVLRELDVDSVVDLVTEWTDRQAVP